MLFFSKHLRYEDEEIIHLFIYLELSLFIHHLREISYFIIQGMLIYLKEESV